MTEFFSTAKGPLVDSQLQVWGAPIPVYLFLGGWAAGLLVLSGWALIAGRTPRRRGGSFALTSSGPFLVALVAISVGMLALFLDLEHKLFVWRLYLTFEPWSPMSWGSWILLLVYPVLLAGTLIDPPRILHVFVPRLTAVSESLARSLAARQVIGYAALVSGAALGIYTGILLSAMGARPFWNSALLGPLFLTSGLSAGAAFGHMMTPDPEERRELARADNLFLTTELGWLGLLLLGLATAGHAHAEAARLVLGGPLTAVFWVLVVGLGILVPLAIQLLAVSNRIDHTPVGPLLVLLGGLALRFVVVQAGQFSRWPRF